MKSSLTVKQQELAAGYVLGDLSPEELNLFETELHLNPELQQEVDIMMVALEYIPQSLPIITPPLRLQEQIFQSKITVKSSRLKLFKMTWSKWVAGFGIIATFILGVYSFEIRQKLTVAQEAVSNSTVAAILQRPTSRLISLKGYGNEASGNLLFVRGEWKEVIVSLGRLPTLPPGKTYRMWLALNNGRVISCGSFNSNEEGAVFVKLNPAQSPSKTEKVIEIFVTTSLEVDPLVPEGSKVMTGQI